MRTFQRDTDLSAKKFQAARLDGLATWVTLAVVTLEVVLITLLILNVVYDPHMATISTLAFSTIVLLIPVLFFVKRYHISSDNIEVVMPFSVQKIPLCEILSISRLSKNDLPGTLRVFACGGVFGYFGIFWNPSLGRMRWFVTNRNELVLIRLKHNLPVIVSPIHAALFIDTINQTLLTKASIQ